MSEQTKNIIWMAEELDFSILPEEIADTQLFALRDFWRGAINHRFSHSLYPASK